MSNDVNRTAVAMRRLAISWLLGGLTFGLQYLWEGPSIILGTEATHAALIVVAALAWMGSVIWVFRADGKFGLLSLVPTPFAMMVPLLLIWMVGACMFAGRCL